KVLPVLTLKSTPNSICDVAKGFNGSALQDVLTDANAVGGDTYTFAWSTGNTMGAVIGGQTNSTLTNKNGGFYTATVTNNRLKCTSNPETVEIKNNQVLPAISNVLTASTNCAGGAANGQIASSVTNGVLGETFAFQWYSGNTVTIGSEVPNAPNNGNTATAIQLAGGANYTVSVYNNVSGCTNTLTSTLTDGKELPALTLTAQPNTICDPLKATSGAFDGQVAADIVTVGNYAASVSADFEYTWDADPAVVGKRLLTNKDVGTYSVFVEHITTKCKSTVYKAQVTTAKTLPTIVTDQQASTNCVGGLADGIAQVTNVVPNGKHYTYNWYDGNTIAGAPARQITNTTATTDNYSGIQGGLNGVSLFQYTVEVTVLESGCTNTEVIGVDDDSQVPVLGALVPTDNTLCTVAKNGSATVGTLTYRGVAVNPVNYSDYTFVWTGVGTQGPPQTYTALAAGNYTLTAENKISKCTSNPASVTIKDNLFTPKIDVATVDQTSCDPLTPNGSVSATIDETAIAGVTGVTAGYSFRWDDLVKPATANTASFSSLKGNQNYTITATRTATGCSNTQTIFLNETLTTPTVTVAVTNLTTCVPANGQLVATPSPAATYNFFWYNGSDAIDENAVIAGANFTGGAIYSNLVPGDYTVVVQNSTSKCKSSQVIKTVSDNSPKITPVAQNTTLPADCNAFGGVMDGAVQSLNTKFSALAGSATLVTTTPLGLAVNSKVLVSRDVALSLPIPLSENNVYFIESIAGNNVTLSLTFGGPAITFTSNGNGTIGDFVTSGYNYQWFAGVPSPTNGALGSINYFTNPPVYSGAALSSTSNLSGVATGLYTVQVTDPATGCKNFHSQTLPFIGSHAVLKITKTNSTICTPGFATGNGSIEIQIESPISAPPGTDESDYEITLKKGVAITVPTFTGPVGLAPFFVANGILAPGSYIVEVKETYSTFDCIISQDVIIDSDALVPVVSLTGPIIPNTACTVAGADGRIDINVDKDPKDVTVGTTYTIDFAPDPNAAFPLAAQPAGNYSALNLTPQTYTVTALASTGCTATKSFTVIDSPVKSELRLPDLTLADAEFCDSNLETKAKAVVNQIKLIGGGAENINDYQFDWFTNATLTTNILSSLGDNTATKGGEELSNVGAPLPSQKVTNQDYWVVVTKKTDLSGTGGIGCASPPLNFRIDANKINPQLVLTPAGDPSCDPAVFQGNITVDVTTASGPGAGMLYDYAWTPNGGAGQPSNSAGNSGIANVLSSLNEGLYSLTALNQATGCTATLSTTLVKITPPVFTVDATPTNLTNCVSPGFLFNGKIDGVQVFVDGLPGTVTDFDYVWFKSDLLPASKVLDGVNVAVPVDDQLTLTTYPAIAVDKYFVKAVRKSGGAGIGCESAPLRKDILDDKVLPQVTVSSTPNDACIAPNWDGSITVKAGTTGFGAGTLYDFTWQSNPGTAGIVVTNGTNQMSVAPVAPSLLSLST
ncbi:MAG: hypothetical protein HYZ44_08240, partial [Bacteroidetes bacterium]|nr:hypothetical protein [Bacteroidota bacterium]